MFYLNITKILPAPRICPRSPLEAIHQTIRNRIPTTLFRWFNHGAVKCPGVRLGVVDWPGRASYQIRHAQCFCFCLLLVVQC